MACQKHEDQLVDYLEGTLPARMEQELRDHLMNCEACQKELEQQREILRLLEIENKRIEIPHDFMEQVEAKVYQPRQKRKWKPTKWQVVAAAIALCVLLVSTNVTSGLMNGMMHWWKSITSNQMASGERIPGEEVNITAVDQNIRITITHVAADEYGTDLYYEIEDLNKEGLHEISFIEKGISFSNDKDVWIDQGRVIPKPVVSFQRIDVEDKPSVIKGKISLISISPNYTTLQMAVSQIAKIYREDVQANHSVYNSVEVIGDWHFDIPVSKHEEKNIQINQNFVVDGIEGMIETITVTPARTLLRFSHEGSKVSLHVPYLKSGEKIYREQGEIEEQNRIVFIYEPIYYDDLEYIEIHFGSLTKYFVEGQGYPIHLDQKFPQTFEYEGATVSIDKVEIGTPTIIEISSEMDPNRVFNRLSIEFSAQNSSRDIYFITNEVEQEYMVVNRQGDTMTFADWESFNIYRENRMAINGERVLTIKQKYELVFRTSNHRKSVEEVIPEEMYISGYTQTKLIDDVVTIKFE